ncbi:MAG: peptidylprolyl isomerase [Rhodanobacter sp.]
MFQQCMIAALAMALSLPAWSAGAVDSTHSTPSVSELLAKSKPTEWRRPDLENLLYMQLPTGRVVIELAPDFTPLHAANIRALVRAHYFDGLAIIRVQDNFVTQWGAPEEPKAGYATNTRPYGNAKTTLPPEFTRHLDPALPWTALPDGDVYAPEVGFSEGFPAARDPASGEEWLTHCYGMVGVGRDNSPDSGDGSSLYTVIGQAPRTLDRNLAVVGRVLEGMPLLSGLPRGAGAMGFYSSASQRTPVTSVRMAADLPASKREPIEVLRTDSATFAALIEAKRNRHDAFYARPAGKISLCNIPVPVRDAAGARAPDR